MADITKPPESPAEAAALLGGTLPPETAPPLAKLNRQAKGKQPLPQRANNVLPERRTGQPCEKTSGCAGQLQEYTRHATQQERKITLICGTCRKVQAVQTTVIRQR